MTKFDQKLDALLDRIRSGDASSEEVGKLEKQLAANPELRKHYRARMRMEAELHNAFQEISDNILPFELEPAAVNRTHATFRSIAMGLGVLAAGIAAVLMIGKMTQATDDGSITSKPSVAVLESVSGDSWEGPLTLSPGAQLSPGMIKLKSGIAHFRFNSGTLVTLEGPAHLDIESAISARLMSGTALVETLEPAHEFVIAMPHGKAVDHGGSFSVSVVGENANCEVLKGAVSVHQQSTAGVKKLRGGQATRISPRGLEELDYLPSKSLANTNQLSVMLRTEGLENTVISDLPRKGFIHPSMLMVKLEKDSFAQRRALFSIPLKDIQPDKIRSVRLNLNLVPSGIGFAYYLPENVPFAVYGITDEYREHWDTGDLLWKDAPGFLPDREKELNMSEVRLIGKFTIPRGQQSGRIQLENDELLAFLRSDTSGLVSFVIVRETYSTREYSLVHAFASSQHPEASGPSLEVIVDE